MVSFTFSSKENGSKVKVSVKESGSKLKTILNESILKLQWPFLSKNRREAAKKKKRNAKLLSESNLELKSWIDCWKGIVPVISASEEFYGLPKEIAIIIWTYVLEFDEKPNTFCVTPSLMEDVYHANDIKIKKINTTGRSLLRINSLSRELALQKYAGTLPIFAGPGRPPQILRFNGTKDVIYIKGFHKLLYQIIEPTESGFHESETELILQRAKECVSFYPQSHNATNSKFNKMPKRKVDRLLFNFNEECSEYFRSVIDGLKSDGMKVPRQTWSISQSIQNLKIDYDDLNTVVQLLAELLLERQDSFDVDQRRPLNHSLPISNNELYIIYEAVPALLKFLRQSGELKTLRLVTRTEKILDAIILSSRFTGIKHITRLEEFKFRSSVIVLDMSTQST